VPLKDLLSLLEVVDDIHLRLWELAFVEMVEVIGSINYRVRNRLPPSIQSFMEDWSWCWWRWKAENATKKPEPSFGKPHTNPNADTPFSIYPTFLKQQHHFNVILPPEQSISPLSYISPSILFCPFLFHVKTLV
jgi:hypothetical protein